VGGGLCRRVASLSLRGRQPPSAVEGGGIAIGHACGVHSEHDLKEQSDAQIIVSRFPFRGEGSKGSKGGGIALRAMSLIIPLRGMENHTTGLRPLEMLPYPRLRQYFS